MKLVSGFTAVLGLAARKGKSHVLEMSNAVNDPALHTSDIVSVDLSGHKETVASELDCLAGVTSAVTATSTLLTKASDLVQLRARF